MSGPKVSAYTLSAEERKVLIEQMERNRQIAFVLRNIEKGLAQAEEKQNRLAAMADRLRVLFDQTDMTCGIDEKKAAETLKSFRKQLEEIQKAFRTDKAGSIELSPERNREREEKLKSLQMLNQKIEEEIRLQKETEKQLFLEIEKADEKRKEELEKQILKGFSVSFSGLKRKGRSEKESQEENGKAEQLQEKEKLQREKNRVNTALFEAADQVGDENRLTPKLKEKLSRLKTQAQEITSADFMENFLSISVLPFVKECRQYAKLSDEYDRVYAYEQLLCEAAGIPAKAPEVTEEGIREMKEEISRLTSLQVREEEEVVISDAVDSAMRQMGYCLVGHRTAVKKSGKRIRHELYDFGEGSGIDVTYADNGQISMELGGFDSRDRSPEEAEAEKLTEEMERFCSEYAVMEKILEEKGVQRRNLQLLPPAREYAQIINTTDYEMTGSVDYFELSKKQRTVQTKRHQ